MIPALMGLASAVLKPVLGIIDKNIEDKDLAARLKVEAQMAVMSHSSEELKAATQVIVAEAKSESWLARNWRPMIMTMFGFIILNNYVLYPYLMLFGLPGVMLDLPPMLWNLIQIGLGGYVVGRSGEKIAKAWKGIKS